MFAAHTCVSSTSLRDTRTDPTDDEFDQVCVVNFVPHFDAHFKNRSIAAGKRFMDHSFREAHKAMFMDWTC